MKNEKKYFAHLHHEPKEPEKRKSFVFVKTGKKTYALALVKYKTPKQNRLN